MIPTPVQSALETLRDFEVATLLIGGQACVLYGGAEFSRDLDLMLAATPASLERLAAALAALQANVIAVPSFEPELLDRGHAVHFRCGRPDVAGLRLDVMTRPPRLGDIRAAWQRHVVFELDIGRVSVLALEDLISTKKTQRDKDWATIGELVASDMVAHQSHADDARVGFWLREAREADTLIELTSRFPEIAVSAADGRPLLRFAIDRDRYRLEVGLAEEQIHGKEADRQYWAPLRSELETMPQDHRRLGGLNTWRS